MRASPGIRATVLVATVASFLLHAAPAAVAQCAMCKEAVDADKALGGGLADGISMSILFMLALPVSVLGGFSFAIWRAYRNAEADDTDAA
ncbi:MAG TPA: hypothetical protein VGC54_05995 [Planctomycetota bacterium]